MPVQESFPASVEIIDITCTHQADGKDLIGFKVRACNPCLNHDFSLIVVLPENGEETTIPVPHAVPDQTPSARHYYTISSVVPHGLASHSIIASLHVPLDCECESTCDQKLATCNFT